MKVVRNLGNSVHMDGVARLNCWGRCGRISDLPLLSTAGGTTMLRWTLSTLLVGLLLQGAVGAPKRKVPPPDTLASPPLHAALQAAADAQALAGRIDFWLEAR